METINKQLQLRVLEITKKLGLSHLSSTLPAVNILNKIYSTKRPQDKVVLSNGHSGLGLYVVLEKYYPNVNAEKMVKSMGIHPDIPTDDTGLIDCSTGSLGLGILVAVGMAVKSKDIDVYCVISDGETAEGSVWEALRFIGDNKLTNIKVYLQMNGYGAYSKIEQVKLAERVSAFYPDVIPCITDTNFLKLEDPLKYHYKVLDDNDYEEIKRLINEEKIQTTIIEDS